MTTAISDILKQVEMLSDAEQAELTARLIEYSQQPADTAFQNGTQYNSAIGSLEDSETEEGIDVFSLNHVPPKDSYVVMMEFVDAGRGEPARYDFSDIFDDEERESED